MQDFITPTPFSVSVAVDKLCSEIYCGQGSTEDLVTGFFPVVIALLFIIPVVVVGLSMFFNRTKSDSELLKPDVSPSNVWTLLLMSVVIAGALGVFYFYV